MTHHVNIDILFGPSTSMRAHGNPHSRCMVECSHAQEKHPFHRTFVFRSTDETEMFWIDRLYHSTLYDRFSLDISDYSCTPRIGYFLDGQFQIPHSAAHYIQMQKPLRNLYEFSYFAVRVRKFFSGSAILCEDVLAGVDNI